MAKYFDVTWNENDLLQCKQALLILDEQGVPFGDIYELEQMGAFGNLNVNEVLMEIYGCECLEPNIGIGCF